jgi:TRAP-type C4-dicarboxylate transport system permease small subunit
MDPVLTSWQYGSVTDGLRIVRVWFLLAVPIGFSMMMVRLVQSMIRDVTDMLQGRPVFTGSKLFE